MVLALVPGQFAQATTGTWNGSALDSNWATLSNWTFTGTGPFTVPGTLSGLSTETANFTGNLPPERLTVNPDTGRIIRTLSFDSNAGNYVIGGTNTLTLNSQSGAAIGMAITLLGSNKTETVSCPLLLADAGATSSKTYYFINANTDSSNVFNISSGITAGNAYANNTLNLAGLNTGENVISGVIGNGAGASTLRLMKIGAGNWTLTGQNTYTGSTWIRGGTLTLDFTAIGNDSEGTKDILYSNVTNKPGLILGTNLLIKNGSGNTNTQHISAIDMISGGEISIQPGAGGSISLIDNGVAGTNSWHRDNQGGLGGGTLNIALGANATFTIKDYSGSRVGLVNNVLTTPGGVLALTTFNGANWATLDDGAVDRNVIALSAYANDTDADAYTVSTNNIDVTSSISSPGAVTPATLAFRANQNYVLSLPSGATLNAGGILVANTVGADKTVTIKDGTLAPTSTSKEIVFHQYSGGTVKLESDVVNYGGGTTIFTKSGDGTLILTGTKSYTGRTNVSRGVLQLGDGTTDGAVSGPMHVNVGGTLTFNNVNPLHITNEIRADRSGLDNGGSANVVKKGTGTLYLDGVSTSSVAGAYWTFKEGVVSTAILDSINDGSTKYNTALGGASNPGMPVFTFDGGTLQFTGSYASALNRGTLIAPGGATYDASGTALMTVTGSFYLTGTANRTVTLTGSGTGFLSSTFADPLGGGKASLVKNGTGVWKVSLNNGYTGDTLINQGVLQLYTTSATNRMTALTNLNIAGGAYLDLSQLPTTTEPQALYLRAGQTIKGDGALINGFTGGGATPITPTAYGALRVGILAGSATNSYVSPGSSGVGTLTTGSQTWYGSVDPVATNGAYLWEVNSVDALGGLQTSGADLLDINGTLTLALTTGATETHFKIAIDGLNGTTSGAVTHWNKTKSYDWTIVTTDGDLAGLNLSYLTLDTSAFTAHNDITGSVSDGSFSLSVSGNNLMLHYAAAMVPEPSTIAMLLTGLGALALVVRRRK